MAAGTNDLYAGLFPEIEAGGFSRINGTVEFYARVNALLRQDMTVVDYGAGRGEGHVDDQRSYVRELRMIRGKVKKVIGVDVDAAVLSNPGVDEALLLSKQDDCYVIPLDDSSVDLIVVDWVFEHLEHPRRTCAELDRVLRPGGWVCGRTPNRWGYIGIGGRMVHTAKHSALLRVLQPMRKEKDIFPTYYRLNSRASLVHNFSQASFDHYSYTYNPEPAYIGRSRLLGRLLLGYARMTPSGLAAVWHVFVRKKKRCDAAPMASAHAETR